jgi:hypothetical protein
MKGMLQVPLGTVDSPTKLLGMHEFVILKLATVVPLDRELTDETVHQISTVLNPPPGSFS